MVEPCYYLKHCHLNVQRQFYINTDQDIFIFERIFSKISRYLTYFILYKDTAYVDMILIRCTRILTHIYIFIFTLFSN